MLAAMTNNPQAELAELVGAFYDDPLGHVLISYPWGSGRLRGRHGPSWWQRDLLLELGEAVRDNAFDGSTPAPPIQFSTASGHGIGKSALVAWIIRWIMDTRPHAKGVVTANTAPQLRTKTWAELAKWHYMGLTKEWFELTSGQGSLTYYHKDYPEEWRVDGQTCREENSEAFAGLHAATSTPFYIFDEASAVPKRIYEVREGGLTDGEPMTFDFGNPTRNSGPFFENMLGRFRHRYRRRFIDSRTVPNTNKALFDQWAEDYGVDSDFFKVRVRGLFPDQGAMQLIPTSYYEDNVDLDVHVHPAEPRILGVDVARYGSNESVLWLRQGRDATLGGTPQTPGHWRFSGMDTMQLAAKVVEVAMRFNVDAVNIDGGGVGGGVVDRCRQLGLDVFEVNAGETKGVLRDYKDRRAQMWGQMRDALRDGIRLPASDDLRTDLTSLQYGYDARNRMVLESKEEAMKRGISSPDLGDALALTWATQVVPRASRTQYEPLGRGSIERDERDYDPMDY